MAGSNESRDDHALVDACNTGDGDTAAAAFEALYARHRDYVLRVALRFARDPELAADALQETFMYLLRQFPPAGAGLTLTARLTTYLYPIAKNFAISAARRARRFEPCDLGPDDLPAPAAAPRAEDDLDRALAGLPAERREVLVLRFVDDMALSEIAAALGIPLGTVKSRLHLGIRQLKNDRRISHLFDA